MSEGWGQDFDEDGNVIGDVPDDDPSFVDEHKYKIAIVASVLFLLNLPQTAPNGAAGLIGSAVGSVFLGSVLVFLGVGIRKRI